MNDDPCTEMQLLLQAELDGQLDAAASAGLTRHLATCPDCQAMRAALERLSLRLRAEAPRHVASPALRRAVGTQLPIAPRRFGRSHAGAFGAGMALAAAIAAFMLVRPPSRDAPDVVAAHIRALQPGHLYDVASSDEHTVKPWFDGRIDFAPPVRNLAAQGFSLVGGRLDYLDGRPVAALVYGHAKHLIDVFVWPGSAPDRETEIQGYNVVTWSAGGMQFRAVSDLNSAELSDLVLLLRADP